MEVSYLQLIGLFLAGYICGMFRKKIKIALDKFVKWGKEQQAIEKAKKTKLKEESK